MAGPRRSCSISLGLRLALGITLNTVGDRPSHQTGYQWANFPRTVAFSHNSHNCLRFLISISSAPSPLHPQLTLPSPTIALSLPQLPFALPSPTTAPSFPAPQLSLLTPHHWPFSPQLPASPQHSFSPPLCPRHTPHDADLLPKPTGGPLQLRSCPLGPLGPAPARVATTTPGREEMNRRSRSLWSTPPWRRRSEALLSCPTCPASPPPGPMARGLGARKATKSGSLEDARSLG